MRHTLRNASRLSIVLVGMVACLALAACSGGESGGGTASVATPITGTFVDSPVNGLHYTTLPSNPAGGVTVNGGQYQCAPGDTVTFDLGGRVIGTGQPCGEQVTVVSVFGATSITDLRVRNLAQLLLTLGGIPADSQPIELPVSIPATLPTQLNFSDPQFEQMLQTAFSGRALVSQDQVAAHLSASFKTVTVTGVTSGTVTSIPAGLVCTGGTCSYDFVRGTRVILAAVGTGFTGWNGDGCTGAGTCEILLTATQAIRAVFVGLPPPPRMTTNRAAHAAVRLPNGQVLITGGFSSVPNASAPALNTAELYDPVANTFRPLVHRMVSARASHTATLLLNGQVLLAGGHDAFNSNGMNTAELYNPATHEFTPVSSTMPVPRGGHADALLPNGQVLLVGGFNGGHNDPPVAHNTAVLYDPGSQTFTAIADTMAASRDDSPTATLLPNGLVLITGGGSLHVTGNTAEVYNPATQTFAALTATMTSARQGHAAVLLNSGQVLLTGGAIESPSGFTFLDSLELYDPSAQTFTALTATMESPRGFHGATLLSNGRVLLTGGARSASPIVLLNSAELYTP